MQQEHYNSELALRLLGRFPEADVERALKLLREKVASHAVYLCAGRADVYVCVGGRVYGSVSLESAAGGDADPRAPEPGFSCQW